MPRPRGYAMLIVLVVGIVAALATMTLLEVGLHGQVTAVHADLGNRTRAIGEAGMNHAIQLLVAQSDVSVDFDAVLDVGLDVSCGSLPPTAGPEDNVPPEALGFTPVTYDDERYGMRLFGGGAYLVRFDDDDDELVTTAAWRSLTGNNEGTTGCVEGPPALDGVLPSPYSSTGNHAAWKDNPLRDRNGSVWITTLALYPVTSEADLDRAQHRAVLRKMHTVVRSNKIVGLKVRGNLDIGGSGSLAACSAIGAAEIDGQAMHNGSTGGGCACGNSEADAWSDKWTHCTESTTINCDGTITTASGHSVQLPGCAPGELKTPGPSVPTVPAIDSEADELVDFSRSCVFFVDNNGASGSDNSLWVWDADREVGGTPCRTHEGSGGAMPIPDPDGGFPGACWTPLLLQMEVAPAAYDNSPTAGTCFWTPFQGASGAVDEKVLATKGGGTPTCGWAPDGLTAGQHVIARPDPANPLGWDALSQKMSAVGLALFDEGTVLHKPAWGTACQVTYPPFDAAPTTYSCLREDSGCVAGNAGSTDNVALLYIAAEPAMPWFPVRDRDDALAVPAGVYYFPHEVRTSGDSYGFAAAAHPLNYGDGDPMAGYVLATLATPGVVDLQQPGYFFGAGQDDDGADEPRYRLPALMANGDVTLRGGATQSLGGSLLVRGNLAWQGNGDLFVFGELYSNGNFSVGGSGRFWWIYKTPFTDVGIGTGPALPTQVYSMQ